MNTINAVSAAVSRTGAAQVSMAGLVALSWTGSLFLSTIENYIPNDYQKIKIRVSGAKVVIAFPIRCVEWTSNQIFGLVDTAVVGVQLPTNITETYILHIGPKVEDIIKIKKPILKWLVEKLNALNK